MKVNKVIIGEKIIGEGKPVFIVAEAGVNHNGKFSLAKRLIDAAAEAGADAVKFQTFSSDELVIKNAAKARYQKVNEERMGESQYEMLKRLMLPREHHRKLKRYAEKKGLIFLSTPFSFSDAEFLRELGVKAIKVGSSDANNFPFLRRIASWGLPILLSTGMADIKEIKEAVKTIQNPSPLRGTPFRKGRIRNGTPLILLHCTTNYPTPFAEANLRAIQTLKKEFGLPVGFSDHTMGSEAAVAAVALGACVIEKHFTLDRNLPGPDHKMSLEPEELKRFVQSIRNAEQALGSGEKIPCASEKEIAKVARKSIVTRKPVKKGDIFTEENLGIKRPGTGLPPKDFNKVIGARATKSLSDDTLLTRGDYL